MVPTGTWALESGHRDGVNRHQSANDIGKGKEGENCDRVSACAFGRLGVQRKEGVIEWESVLLS